MLSFIRVFAVVITSLILCVNPVYADMVSPCEPWLANRFIGAKSCQVSDRSTQDFRNNSELTVNKDTFFGHADWAHAFTLEDSRGKGQSGILELPSLLQNYQRPSSEFLFIFKGPSFHYLVGLSIDKEQPTLTWLSPFKHHKNPNKYMDVSHLSVYQRIGDVLMPAPQQDVPVMFSAAFGMLLLGAVGIMKRQKV